MFEKREVAKWIVRFVVGVGTHRIVGEVIDNNVAARSSIDAAFIGAGSVAIGYFASEILGNYTDEKVDKAIDWLEDI